MLNWANRFNICCFLDNHQYSSPFHSIECLLAVGVHQSIHPENNADLRLLLQQQQGNWLFGHVSFNYKDQFFPSAATRLNPIGFADIFFFCPQIVLRLETGTLVIESIATSPEAIFESICKEEIPVNTANTNNRLQPGISKESYIHAIKKLKQHILRGDCYEINFCMEFFGEGLLDPVDTYFKLTGLSPVPFAAFYKNKNSYLLCASPERYMQRKGSRILSQPIKGTIKRNKAQPAEDELLKKYLYNSQKERSENVMVVDLVRNDLSKICREGTVHVDELFGVYTFPQVHQLISTISGELNDEMNLADVLEATFPMGSMTGAPKLKVLQLINEYEITTRGLFSGCVGYIAPNGDFDFNVVIRSILYNSARAYISCQAGSGITYNSDPEKEYEECLLKASAMMQVLGSDK